MAINSFYDLYGAVTSGEVSELTEKSERYSKGIFSSQATKKSISRIMAQEPYEEDFDDDQTYSSFASNTEYGQVLNNSINEGVVNQGLSFLTVFGGCSASSIGALFGDPGVQSWDDIQESDRISEADKTNAEILRTWDNGDDQSIVSRSAGGFNPCRPDSYTSQGLDDYITAKAQESWQNQLDISLTEALEEEEGKGWFQDKEEYDAEIAEQVGNIIADIPGLEDDPPLDFKEQCFLLTYIQSLARVKMELDIIGDKNDTSQNYNKELPSAGASGNRSLLVHSDPFVLMNRLTVSPNKRHFFDMPSESIATLQPMIKLYKVVKPPGDEPERQVEIKFDSYYNDSALDLLKPATRRGHGVGIKSFDFSYVADNPFAVKKSITAKLVIFANNFGELLRLREGNYSDRDKSKAFYKYIDLALKTGDADTFNSALLNQEAAYRTDKTNPNDKDVAVSNAEKLNFRLKAVVGYALPHTNALGQTMTNEVRDAVYDSYITLNLTPTIHDFDIDDLGRVTFTLNYLAYVEDFFDQPSYDIFLNQDSAIDQLKRKIKYIELSEKCDSQQIAELKNSEEEVQKIKEEKRDNLQSLFLSMLTKQKIRVLEVAMADLNRFRLGGPLIKDREAMEPIIEEFKQNIITAGGLSPYTGFRQDSTAAKVDIVVPPVPDEDDEEETTTPSTETINPIESVSFFWVSDLIDVVLENIGTTLEGLPDAIAEDTSLDQNNEVVISELRNYKRYLENFKRFRVVLGPLEIVNTNSTGEAIGSLPSNLGDIPVSVKYFMEFLTNKMLKSNRQTYPLPRFLNDFFNVLVRDFLNNDTCYDNRNKQKVRVSSAAVTAFNEYSDVDDITYWCRQQGLTRLKLDDNPLSTSPPWPVLNVMGKRGQPAPTGTLDNEMNYMVFFAGRTQPMELMNGDREQDHDRGIFHYMIGRERGIVKRVKLQKTNSPGLAEVRFEQEGYDGLQQLLVLYDVEIDAYLDPGLFPGSYIYVDPRGFDPSVTDDITKLGVGGYFMVIQTDHSLGPGKFDTRIEAKWVAQAVKDQEITDAEDVEGGSNPDDPDCQAVRKSTSESMLDSFGPPGKWLAGIFNDDDDGSTGSEEDVT
tara:strand:- start:232 stop:3519 length:3288 start_codon:yes stop_codon:yes gene_type:complete